MSMVPKVEVMKSKPETKCERVPREFCRKEACDPEEGRDECYFRNQVVSDVRQSTACIRNRLHLMPKSCRATT